MANFSLKLWRYTPGVFDQWGFELEHPEVEGTEDNLGTLPKNNILGVKIRYIATNNRYGANYMFTNFYYINLVGAGVLDVAAFAQNSGTYRIGSSQGDVYQRVNAQVGGEVNRTADLIRVSTLDPARIFTGVIPNTALQEEVARRMGGKYPPIPGPEQ